MPITQPLLCGRLVGAVPAALLLLAAAVSLLPGDVTATSAGTQQQGYVVVFKRGFDVSKVRALCGADHNAALGGVRLQGLCRRRFSSVVNGFAGVFSGCWKQLVLPCISTQYLTNLLFVQVLQPS